MVPPVRHLYIHVPFCARRCVYCDFAIAIRREIPATRYVQAVLREQTVRRESGEATGPSLRSVYFGGGTPSLLPTDAFESLASRLLPNAATDAEITLEANPDDVTESNATAWVRAGVNRISLGVQSFDPGALAWMHRTHQAPQAAIAVQTLRAAGVTSISLDVIFALPPALGIDFATELEQVIGLEPDHLSVYGLTVEPRTPLARWISRGRTMMGSDERYAEQFLEAHEFLNAQGYEHYEVSNYARLGHRARHNAAYWTGKPYIGLGPSAHSYANGVRKWNVANWADYERRVCDHGDATAETERLTERQVSLERAYLGLRTVEGLGAAEAQLLDGDRVTAAVNQGWLTSIGDRIRLTPTGWLRLDELVAGLTT